MLSKENYIDALCALKETISPIHYDILSAQYYAPNRTVTAPLLAQMIGFPTHAPINLHYGRLGHLLSDFLPERPIGWNEDEGFEWFRYLSKGRASKNGYLWTMHSALAEALEELKYIDQPTDFSPEEIIETATYSEGAVKQVTVNAYERNPFARRKCIEHYGAKCSVCCFEFSMVYGEAGVGFIQVHHLNPIAEIRGEYLIDPIQDLRPVCPNCHAIIHRKTPAYSIEEVKNMLHNSWC